MSAQPIHHEHGRYPVPRTIDGIAAALTPSRRMEFYREVGQAPVDRLQEVVATWWAHAMLDRDPEREQVIAAARAGTLPTVTMAEVFRARREAGGPMPSE